MTMSDDGLSIDPPVPPLPDMSAADVAELRARLHQALAPQFADDAHRSDLVAYSLERAAWFGFAREVGGKVLVVTRPCAQGTQASAAELVRRTPNRPRLLVLGDDLEDGSAGPAGFHADLLRFVNVDCNLIVVWGTGAHPAAAETVMAALVLGLTVAVVEFDGTEAATEAWAQALRGARGARLIVGPYGWSKAPPP